MLILHSNLGGWKVNSRTKLKCTAPYSQPYGKEHSIGLQIVALLSDLCSVITFTPLMSQQQLPLIDLVINDESIVNDRGYNVLNSGLDRTRYDLNPIVS